MKQVLSLFLFLSLFVFNVSAATYKTVNKEMLNYEINDFYIEGDEVIINGWAIIDKDVQHFIDSSTHSYSFYIENKYDSSDNYVYNANMLSADKTSMFKYTTTTKMCSLSSTYNDAYSCYTRYENVGFEVSIPLKDLSSDAEYQIYLRINGKTAGVYYQIAVYVPGVSESYSLDGIGYELISDFSTVNLTVITEHLFVRSGPDISLNEVYGSYSACAYGKRLYWAEYKTFSTLQEVYQTGSSYDDDTWFRLLYNEGLCQDSRSRAIMGYSYSGWIASVHTDFSGTPAIIKTTLLENINVGDIITYTSKSETFGNLSIDLENEIEQKLHVLIYYSDDLVVDDTLEFSGEKVLEYDFLLDDYGEIYITVTEENGVMHEYFTEIFISSEEIYYVYNSDSDISPDTPVMVIKNGASIKYIYEQVQSEVAYNYILPSAGEPFYSWVLINYSVGSNNIYLNSDIYSYGVYPSADETLYLDDDNGYLIELEKTDSNNYQALFNVPNMYLSNPDGAVYISADNLDNYVNGGRMWYTPLTDNTGSYDYTINIENVGVNSIDIIFVCEYEIYNTIFGNSDSKYVIKRVEEPDDINYIIYKKYDIDEINFYKESLLL